MMNQGFGKFQPTQTAARTAAPAAAPQRVLPRQSRWSGLGDGSQRLPMLEPGVYRVRVGRCEIKVKPKGAPNAGRETFHATVEVVQAVDGSQSPAGMVASVIAMLSTDAGQNEMFRMIRSAAGFESEEAFYAAIPADGTAEAFFDAVVGQSSTPNPIEGRLVDVQVSQGKDDGKGGYYRNYVWAPVPEAEQSAA